MRGERTVDIGTRCATVLDQVRGPDDDAGGAEAALRTSARDERVDECIAGRRLDATYGVLQRTSDPIAAMG